MKETNVVDIKIDINALINEAFSDSFIESNLSNCNSIIALQEGALNEINCMNANDFTSAKEYLRGLVEAYANSAKVLSYCLGTIRDVKRINYSDTNRKGAFVG